MKVFYVDLHYKNIHNAICFIKKIYSQKNTFRFIFVKYGKIHNEKFPAEYIVLNTIQTYINKYYHIFNLNYGSNFSNKQWKKQVKQLKRTHNLKVFI